MVIPIKPHLSREDSGSLSGINSTTSTERPRVRVIFSMILMGVLYASGNFSDVKSLRLIFSSADLTEIGRGIAKFTAHERSPGVQSQFHHEIDICLYKGDIEIAFPKTDIHVRSMSEMFEEK